MVRHLFSDRQLHIISYCAEEVRRQMDGPQHVGYMVAAWEYAWTRSRAPDFKLSSLFVETVGAIVTPKNSNGFRSVPVFVGPHRKMDAMEVPRAVHNLVEAWNEGRVVGGEHWSAGEVGPAESFYHEFEEIHPFNDGNGRTGKILYNLVKGTLADPVWPPDFFGGISNP